MSDDVQQPPPPRDSRGPIPFRVPRRRRRAAGASDAPRTRVRKLRLMAILVEHTAGKWPLWLSPRQAIVIPVAEPYEAYAKEVQATLHAANFFVSNIPPKWVISG